MSPKQTARAPLCALLLVCLCAASLNAQQQPCQQPAVSAAARAQSIFSPRQEMGEPHDDGKHLLVSPPTRPSMFWI